MIAATFACACLFALIHVFIHRLRVLDTVPRSRWLSMAGGVAVAYVFLHILPELSAHQETLAILSDGDVVGGEQIVYAVALAGLALFYGLERAIKEARSRGNAAGRPGSDPGGAPYALHLASFALYNGLVGYLLVHREETGWLSLALYALAMGLHFLTTDFGLLQDHRGRWLRAGRWVLTGSLMAGWSIGALTAVPEVAVALLFAFLAGGVVLNVLKEELPEERRSRFGAFAGGAAVYAALLLAL